MAASDHDNSTAADVERLRAERDALRQQVATLQHRDARGGVPRRAFVVVLVILACLTVTAAAVAVWANQTMLTTNGWVETIGPLGDDPAVTAALQPRITDAVFTAIPAEDLISDALPEDRAFLAVPLSSAIRSFVDDQVGTFLASDRFAELWVDANEVTHEGALRVLRGESDIVDTTDDTVTLNLLPMVNGALGQLGGVASDLVGQDVTLPTISGGELPDQARERLSEALGVDLPDNIGEIVVYDADELIVAQQALRLFDQTLLVLVLAAPLLVAAAIWLSRNRRSTVLQVAIGSTLLLVLVRRAVLRFQQSVLALPPEPEGRAAAEAVTDQVRAGLFELTGLMIAVALVVVVVALLTGPYGWAVALRRGVAQVGRMVWTAGARVTSEVDGGGVALWMVEHRQALQIGGALAVLAVLLLVQVPWIWLFVLLALLALWELVLWRLGADTETDATTAPL